MNSRDPAPHLRLSFLSQGLKVWQEEVGAATDWAASLGRCGRSCSWWPFSCSSGFRQVRNRPTLRGPTAPHSLWSQTTQALASPVSLGSLLESMVSQLQILRAEIISSLPGESL